MSSCSSGDVIIFLPGALYFVIGRPDRGVAKHLHDELEAFLLLTDIPPELLGEHPGWAPVAAG